MGAWRHFGERLEPVSTGRDLCSLSPRPGEGAWSAVLRDRIVADVGDSPTGRRERDAGDVLARVVESEILPRLMLAHRRPAGRGGPAESAAPTPAEIERFAALLLDPGTDDVRRRVDAILDGGLPLDSLLLDLLAPAARHLGALWEEDACDFVQVTTGLGRLQAITRLLCARLEDDAVPASGRSVLLLPSPGETHVYALAIVASFFREAGWDVTTAGAEPGLDLVELVRSEHFDVIGLTLSCDVFLPATTAFIAALREASRNRGVRLMVGGPYFASGGGDAYALGADAYAADGRAAPGIAEALLDMRVRAC